MTEREIKQLVKLLTKFAQVSESDGVTAHVLDARIKRVIWEVRQWVTWYGRDEMGMKLRSRDNER